jgi:hypothetical protein
MVPHRRGVLTHGDVSVATIVSMAEEEAAADSGARGRAVRRDDSGEYVLNHEEATMIFSAAPKEGEGGAWPVGTEEERRLVPERFQEKMRGLLEVLEKGQHAEAKVSG